MDQDDPEKRLADREERLAEQKDDADLRPAHHDLAAALPSQTPGYARKVKRAIDRVVWGSIALLVVGFLVIDIGHHLENDEAAGRVVWLGVALLLLSVLIAVASMIKVRMRGKKETALQEPGTVELITLKSAYDARLNKRRFWDLTTEMQIRLDSGPTFRGSYCTSFNYWHLQDLWRRAFAPEPGRGRLTPPFPKTQRAAVDAIFHVGASWRCLYNPKNPNEVVVFPFAARGDRLIANRVSDTDFPDYLSFWSAT
jgi:hypothetical protein